MHSAKAVLKLAFFKGGNARIHGFPGTIPTRAAKRATATVPIVMVSVADPVGSGLVANLAHPGGNVTGLSMMTSELSPKGYTSPHPRHSNDEHRRPRITLDLAPQARHQHVDAALIGLGSAAGNFPTQPVARQHRPGMSHPPPPPQ